MEVFVPRDKQQQVLELCLENKRFGVFMDMGTGKTATMLSLIDYLVFDEMSASKVLILAPSKVIDEMQVWQNEISKWENFAYMDYLQIKGSPAKRIEMLKNNKSTITLMNDSMIDWYEENIKSLSMFDIIILDESSRYKSHKTNKFKALVKMIKPKHRIYLLSGTPMPNDYQDMWSQMYLLDGGERLGSNYYQFIRNYAYPINEFKFKFLPHTVVLLNRKLSDICLFVDSSEVELPPKNEHMINLSWGEAKDKQFKEFKKEYVLSLGQGELTVRGVTGYINKSLQMSNGCVYTDNVGNYEIYDNTKLDWVRKFSKTARDNMLVFYIFKFDKKRLLELPGARAIETEQDVKDWNDGLIKIGVISPYSFQYGGNFQQGGSIVIWFGLLWGLENYLQSNKRVWRSGQKKEVDIYYLLMDNTNDINVYKRLISKDLAEQEFLESIKII